MKTKQFTDAELQNLILTMIPKARPYHPVGRAYGCLSEAEIKQSLNRLFVKGAWACHWIIEGKEYYIRVKSPSQWRGESRYRLLVEPAH